ncbi:GNAT family N-acetyltransferase [Cohnella thailandensis]|uniref:GNAT family N-acetyltransferase n=1 Tax=Cohnella thailandensis TaxID=557557 RepID=A0A841T7R7_9BACL|nr:GNAT family N-acetyltransferase [Cohnella thailandensis]MBB6638298.1 GNAT family N-acetyltransferase [Cohnella thailandensis]MBP1977223.1 N-acetylglutamate synthase-like GNAT family acetyltransferase [Cohnella thailandensis]
MSITIRFGNSGDSNDVLIGDQHIPKHILSWKLQNQEIVLAKDDEDLIGYLRVEFLWSKFPYIGLIMVHPDYRGKGLGKGMLQYVEEHLKSKGLRKIYSSSQVNESPPQEWHRKMGFKECGIINGINEGNIGEVFFVKEL